MVYNRHTFFHSVTQNFQNLHQMIKFFDMIIVYISLQKGEKETQGCHYCIALLSESLRLCHALSIQMFHPLSILIKSHGNTCIYPFNKTFCLNKRLFRFWRLFFFLLQSLTIKTHRQVEASHTAHVILTDRHDQRQGPVIADWVIPYLKDKIAIPYEFHHPISNVPCLSLSDKFCS